VRIVGRNILFDVHQMKGQSLRSVVDGTAGTMMSVRARRNSELGHEQFIDWRTSDKHAYLFRSRFIPNTIPYLDVSLDLVRVLREK
jgi:hypothetical protein